MISPFPARIVEKDAGAGIDGKLILIIPPGLFCIKGLLSPLSSHFLNHNKFR
jgi:hypothetical protein